MHGMAANGTAGSGDTERNVLRGSRRLSHVNHHVRHRQLARALISVAMVKGRLI